jgi:hypothetical protein
MRHRGLRMAAWALAWAALVFAVLGCGRGHGA